MAFKQIVSNPVLQAALLAWFLAQLIKLVIETYRNKKVDWHILMSAGGMPSSHASSITAAMLGAGLFEGFDTPLFGLAFVISMIVLYDAAGVRRQAGRQAEKINKMINELLQGHPLSQEQLQEVLGHTPFQVFMGFLLGIGVTLVIWLLNR
ncbi:MAG: divergent PAP2 family protein [Anaerolineaceae bacterium]|nr:divergent PAP2 family protein [Anaerolineaceae bacterium]